MTLRNKNYELLAIKSRIAASTTKIHRARLHEAEGSGNIYNTDANILSKETSFTLKIKVPKKENGLINYDK